MCTGYLRLFAGSTSMAESAAAKAGLIGVGVGGRPKRRHPGRRDRGGEGVRGRRTRVDFGTHLAHHVHVVREKSRVFSPPRMLTHGSVSDG